MGTLFNGITGKQTGPHQQRISFCVRGIVYVSLLLIAQFALIGVVYLETGEKVLYSGLSSDDVAEVSSFLKGKGIHYRISDAGSSILIKGKVESIQKEFEATEWRMFQLQKDQIKNASRELTAKINPDPRRMDAIRKDLEEVLTNGSEKIAWARVGFPHDEKNALEEGEGKVGASVFVGTRGQPLPNVDIERIQWVVANSFAGLKPSDVTVLDEAGRELTRDIQK